MCTNTHYFCYNGQPFFNFLMIMSETTSVNFAVIFPGQGSQALDMMSDWADNPTVIATYKEASDALGFDVWAIQTDESRLNDTEFTQPVLLTASIALWRVLNEHLKVAPKFLAGHSLGEYSALCASGVLSLADAVKLVHTRGRLMKEAVLGMDTQMAAVLGLDDEQVTALCEQTSESVGIVNPANFNSVGQVVIAGTQLGVEKVISEVQTLGKKAMPLKVSVPSHCALMKPASDKLGELLNAVAMSEPVIPVIQNRDAKVLPDLSDIRGALIDQLCEPVRWTATMDKFADAKCEFVVECGFGNVLTNLAKRQNTPIPAFGIDKPAKLEKLLEQFV